MLSRRPILRVLRIAFGFILVGMRRPLYPILQVAISTGRVKIGDSVPKYVVHNAIPFTDIEKANPLEFDFGLSSISKALLFAGALIIQKNILYYVQAFKIVVSNNNAFLILCGEGELRSRIEQLVRRKI